MKIYTADKETGTFIAECKTVEEAKAMIELYEINDSINGIYTENFYDIVNEYHESLIR